MAITQKKIAEALGVSHQLVSFALNGGGTVSEAKRREILEAAQSMGYQRNELARAMVTGRSRILGVMTYDDSVEHIAAIVAGSLQEAVKEGYAVKVLHVPFDGPVSAVRDLAHRCSAWQLDGVVAISLRPDVLSVLDGELDPARCPVAFVENPFAGRDDIVVRTDDRSGLREAIAHLVELGHRRIAHLCGPSDYRLALERGEAFLEVLREFHLPVGPGSVIPTHSFEWADRQSIELAASVLLDEPEPEPERASAVICAGDAAAMIVARVARRRGLRVPEDLSIIGFGNFHLGSHADPPLSTIAQPFRGMGRLATQRLIEHITHLSSGTAHTAHGHDELPAHLVVRESTAAPSS